MGRRKRRLGTVLVALVVAGALAVPAWAGGGLSISFSIPFGHRDGDRGWSGYVRYGSRPYVGVRYWTGARGWVCEPYYDLYYDSGWVFSRRRGRSERVEVAREAREARRSIRNLIQALRFGSSGERERAARELGCLPVDEVTGALVESLLRDPDRDVRREAARSLGNLGAEEARPALRRAARFDPSSRVRRAAQEALRRLGPPGPRPPVWFGERRPGRDSWRPSRRDDAHYEELCKALQRLRFGDKGDRKDAAKKLGKLEDPQAVPALVEALRSDPEEDVREEAAEALGRIGDPRALSALRWAARHDREDDVRKEARKAIEKITD